MDWRSVIQMVSLLMGYQTGWRWDWHSGSRSETPTVYPRWVTRWGTLTDFLMEMLMGSWTVYLRSGFRLVKPMEKQKAMRSDFSTAFLLMGYRKVMHSAILTDWPTEILMGCLQMEIRSE